MPNETIDQQISFDFEAFYRENRLALERFIAFRASPPEVAEEIAADVVCKMWEYVQKTDEPIRQPRALLFHIARNQIINFYEQRKKKYAELPIEDAPPIIAPRSLAGETMIREELGAALGALQEIREEYREVLILHANIGLSISEIAEMMEKTEVNVRVLIFRARRALKKKLQEKQEAHVEEHQPLPTVAQ